MKHKPGKRSKKPSNELYLDGYTLHPNKNTYEADEIEELKNQRAYITDIDMVKDKRRTEVMFALKCSYLAFKETKNPVSALYAFLVAHDEGIYPPLWVLDFLAKEMKKPKSSLFNFKVSPGRGKTNYLKEEHLKGRNGNLMFHMIVLETTFGCEVQEAVDMVHKRFCCKNNDYMIGKGQLFKIHSELYSRSSGLYDFFKEKAPEWTNKDKKKILKNYDRETIPERFHYLL